MTDNYTIDILDIPVASELQVGDMTAGENVIVLDIPGYSECVIRDEISNKKAGVPGILETLELQVDNVTPDEKIVIMDIPENPKYEVVDVLSEKDMDIPKNSEYEIQEIEPYAKIDVPEIPENPRRFSTSHVNRAAKIRSRYLQVSKGTCHNLCKYGMRHADEENTRSPKFKRSTTLKTVRESVTLARSKKHYPSLDSQRLGNIMTAISKENATDQKFKRSITFQGIASTSEGNA